MVKISPCNEEGPKPRFPHPLLDQRCKTGTPLPDPSQSQHKLLSQSEPCAFSGVLRAALETGWTGPNAERCGTRKAGHRRAEPCLPKHVLPRFGVDRWTRPNARRGATEVDAGPLKLAVAAPLPGPSQWEPKLLSQSALGAQSGVLRAALETGWPNPNPEGCFTYTASRCSFCVPPCSIASPLAFGQWTRLQARGPRREHSS